MWRKEFAVLGIMFWSVLSHAQSVTDIDRILAFIGSTEPETLDEYEVERLSQYISHPLGLNVATPSVLRSSGLLTSYQVASLIDYRTHHGDVLSYHELASIDGFNETFVSLLSPFISLDGGSIRNGSSSKGLIRNDLALKGGIKMSNDGLNDSHGVKYRLRIGDGFSVAVSDKLSGHLEWSTVRGRFRIIAGDFNARFGQGLAMWNGMSMTGFSKTSSFYRSASGISSSWSFTGSSSNTGIAAECAVSRIRLSSFVAFPGIRNMSDGCYTVLPALNVGWYGRNVCFSMTHYVEVQPSSAQVHMYFKDMKTSADMAMCVRGVDVFSEVAYDWVNATAAALAGMVMPLNEDFRMALHLRCYPPSFSSTRSAAPRSVSKCSNEYGTSICFDYAPRTDRFSGCLSLDAAYLPVSKEEDSESIQLKITADCALQLSEQFMLKLRVNERIRTWGHAFKTDVRSDIEWKSGCLNATCRLNMLKQVDYGFLGFLEGGYKGTKAAVYLKQQFFIIDNWDDRIYSYERDAPGNFSVPAYYGRGTSTSLVTSWRFSRWGRAYLKAGVISYPFMPEEKKKPGKAELKLQFVFSL